MVSLWAAGSLEDAAAHADRPVELCQQRVNRVVALLHGRHEAVCRLPHPDTATR